MEAIERLGDRSLHLLAAGLEAGRLGPPYTGLSIGRVCTGIEACGVVAAELQSLAGSGWSPSQIAILVRSIATTRESTLSGQKLDLVWTGPEVDGAPSRDTVVVVRELFQQALRSVLVAGYVVYQGRRVFETLAARMDENPDLTVRMFLNIERRATDTSIESDIVTRFVRKFRDKEWPGRRLPLLYYDPRALALERGKRACLHAKCVVIDHAISFVSSANFTEAALERNIEAGILVQSEPFADHLERHFEGLVQSGAMRAAG